MSAAAELEVDEVGVAMLEPVDDVVAVAERAGEVTSVFGADAVPDLLLGALDRFGVLLWLGGQLVHTS